METLKKFYAPVKFSDSLTDRDYQQITQQLFITIDTIKYHKKNILEKFNVRNTAEAIAFASTYLLL